MPAIFYDGPHLLLKIAISAPILYGAIILFIRISGKRSTSQMNNFDWVVTVAMGSLVASGVIMRDIQLAESVFAVFALLALQYVFTLLAHRIPAVESLLKAEPRLLVKDGEFLRGAMRRERVTEAEILAAMRENSIRHVEDVKWVVLESDASLSVLAARENPSGGASAMANVARAGPS